MKKTALLLALLVSTTLFASEESQNRRHDLNVKLMGLFEIQSTFESIQPRTSNIQAQLYRIEQEINRISDEIDRIDLNDFE